MTTSRSGTSCGVAADLTGVERSPNTVKAYTATDLKDFLVFLAGRDVDWREVRLEDLGEYVAWLALPQAGRNGLVAVLHGGIFRWRGDGEPEAGGAGRFLLHQARHGADVGELLTTWQASSRRNGGFRSFLHHVMPASRRPAGPLP